MGGKRHSSSARMRPKTLKCTVHLDIQGVTCPGAVLSQQEDVYLSVCVMGQYRKTAPLPPIFPLLFQHNMVFSKTTVPHLASGLSGQPGGIAVFPPGLQTFCGAVDPSDITDFLEDDTTTIELIQLIPPEGEILATVEENTRDFLYPGPKLTSRAGAPERETLMTRSISFTGISPKLEFSTTSVIQDCDGRDIQPSSVESSPARTCCPSPDRAPRGRPGRGYREPTVASLSRSPSPYTHRRMCQLSEDASQRLAHLRLGPHRFRKETDTHTPFLVPRSPSTSLVETPSPRLSSPRHTHTSTAQHTDSSLLGSYRPKSSRKSSRQGVSRTPLRGVPPSPAHPAPTSTPGRPLMMPDSSSSLRDRVRTSPSSSSHWEEIHQRVQNILLTHGTHRILSSGVEKGSAQQRPDDSDASLSTSRLLQDRSQAPPRDTSVHLDNGTFWSNQAARYRAKPHRAVFEDSLGKIYSNMYRRASSSDPDRDGESPV